jgi:hypothetical protein
VSKIDESYKSGQSLLPKMGVISNKHSVLDDIGDFDDFIEPQKGKKQTEDTNLHV